jgi:hypothetical protein
MVMALSFQKSDEFLQTNYIRNTDEWTRLAYPIPDDIINRGRIFLFRLLSQQTNLFINNPINKQYLEFMVGKNITGVSIQKIYDSLIQFFNQNSNLVILKLREELGIRWVPEPIIPALVMPIEEDMEDVEMIDETNIKPSGPRYAVIPEDIIEDEEMIDETKIKPSGPRYAVIPEKYFDDDLDL